MAAAEGDDLWLVNLDAVGDGWVYSRLWRMSSAFCRLSVRLICTWCTSWCLSPVLKGPFESEWFCEEKGEATRLLMN